MDKAFLRHLGANLEVYHFVKDGPKTEEELAAFLEQKAGKRRDFARRTAKKLIDQDSGYHGFLVSEGGKLSYNHVKFDATITEIVQLFDVVVDQDAKETTKELEEVSRILAGKEKEALSLSEKNEKLLLELSHRDSEIEELKSQIRDLQGEVNRRKVEQKILFRDSVEIGPVEDEKDGIFLYAPKEVMNLPDPPTDRAAFYEVEKIGKPAAGETSPQELTQENYLKRKVSEVVTKKLLKKRAEDNETCAEAAGREVEKVYSKRSKEYLAFEEKYLHNRKLSLEHLINDDRMTNQQKLALYAFESGRKYTSIEGLLSFAGDNCIDADMLIKLLESPDIDNSYQDTVGLLKQFYKASEYKMKKRFAGELIEGAWYIKAKYDGRDEFFTLVPVTEINELRKALGLPHSSFTGKEEKEEEKPKEEPDEEAAPEDTATEEEDGEPDEMESYPAGEDDLDLSPSFSDLEDS